MVSDLTWSLCGHDSLAEKPDVTTSASPNKAIMPATPSDVARSSPFYLISLIKKMLNFSTNQPIPLHLEHEAEKLLSTFQMEVEVNFREGGILHDQLKAWGGKLVGQLIRIAGLFHVTKYAETASCIEDIPTVIDKETLTKAIQLKDYFIAHAEKAFGIMKQNELLVDAQFILGKLLAEQKLVISKQALWQKTKKTI